MFTKKIFIIIFYSLCFSCTTNAQATNKLSLGLNITHFKDWKNKPLNVFNPEIAFAKSLQKEQYLNFSFNIFNSQSSSKDLKVGSIFQRLIFSIDITYEKKISNFSLGVGPSFRYRNEKKILYFYPTTNPFEFVIDPKKGHFDFGGSAFSSYTMPINTKSSIFLKLAYRIYSNGQNPISFGIFYSRYL